MKSTFCKNTFDPANVEVVDTIKLLEDIKNGKYKDQVLKIRQVDNKDERNKLKVKLTGTVWTGRFSYRNKAGLLEHNGLSIFDFDDISEPDKFRDSLKDFDFIFSSWVSPSGNGVKALVRIPQVYTDDEYKEYYNSILKFFDKASTDEKTKDISRLSFSSYDPDLWVNNAATIWETKENQKTMDQSLPIVEYYDSENEIFDKLETWMKNKGEAYFEGQRNNYCFVFASAANRFGVYRDSTEGYLSSNYDLPEKEIRQVVNSAYRNTNQHGTARFENKAEFSKIIHAVSKGESKNNVIKKILDTGIDSKESEKIYDKAVQAVNDKIETFWITYMKNSKTVLEGKPMKYINWLQSAGYFKHYYTNNDYMIVKIDRNIIKEVTIDKIRNYVKKYILSLPMNFDMISREELFEYVFDRAEKRFFGSQIIELLNDMPVNFVKDTEHKAYLYFKNTAIEITKNSINTLKYEELGGYIWENQIIKREFKESNDFEDFDFNIFMKKITGKEKNYNSLKSIAGYMLHGFKNPAISVAPILNDCILSEGINGGTGKGLFVKSLGYIRPMITFDAKNWDINKQFAFQRVNLDTRIIFIDDVQRNFDFEKLFSIITEGITVEKKNKAEFYIQFEDSPKVIIATNYAVSGEGNSHNRRRIEIELVKHYHKDYTPKDEFKRYFYSDWKEKDWLKFDNLMIHCIQYYMENGLVESELENLERKKLISSTNEYFVNWIESNDTFELGTEYKLNELFLDFVSFTGYKKSNLSYLSKMLKEYARYKNEEYNAERKTFNNEKFTVVSIGKVTEGFNHQKLPF